MGHEDVAVDDDADGEKLVTEGQEEEREPGKAEVEANDTLTSNFVNADVENSDDAEAAVKDYQPVQESLQPEFEIEWNGMQIVN